MNVDRERAFHCVFMGVMYLESGLFASEILVARAIHMVQGLTRNLMVGGENTSEISQPLKGNRSEQ